jgi:hypothetical protein
MDHTYAVRLNATERYLLNELDPAQFDQFEEHLFDCQECALDVRATTIFLEHTKNVLAKSPVPEVLPARVPAPAQPHWWSWLSPAIAVPVMAGLLAVIGYQNLVVYPGLKLAAGTAYLVPSASINIATRSAAIPQVQTKVGEPFVLLLNLPSENRFSSYIADLYDPTGRIEWSLPISAEKANDTVPVRVPGQKLAGLYTLAVRAIPQDGGGPIEIGRQPFELRLQ